MGVLRSFIQRMQFLCIFTLPVACYILSVHHGHSRPWLSIISGNYLLMPERAVFAFGMGFYCLLQLFVTGPYTLHVLDQGNSDHLQIFLMTLERTLLGSLIVIAAVPAHLVLGLHATTGVLIVGSMQLWLHTLLYKCRLNLTQRKKKFLFVLLYSGYVAIAGMILSYPPGVLLELMQAGHDLQKRLYLIAWDSRWFTFAVFEWFYYYILFLILFLCRRKS